MILQYFKQILSRYYGLIMKRVTQMMLCLAETYRNIMMTITMGFLNDSRLLQLLRYAQLVVTG